MSAVNYLTEGSSDKNPCWDFLDRLAFEDKGDSVLGICQSGKELFTARCTSYKDAQGQWKDQWEKIDRTVEDILFELCYKPELQWRSLVTALNHPSFAKQKEPFIRRALSTENFLLSKFTQTAVLGVLRVEAQMGLQLFNKNSTLRSLFVEKFAHQRTLWFLRELVSVHLDLFRAVGQEMIISSLEEFIDNHSDDAIEFLRVIVFLLKKINPAITAEETIGDCFDPFCNLLIEVIQKKRVNKFATAALSDWQRQILYKIAVISDNPFVHEPVNPPVDPSAYSINLMWINAQKMKKNQFFLRGEDEKEFQEKFVRPVAEWAKGNPESSINIWVDGKMVNPASIKKAKEQFSSLLKRQEHGEIVFRDVRRIPLVYNHPKAYSEDVPIYFRVDLLKAIIADYVLKNKKASFCVNADLDVTPFSREELFDNNTIRVLKKEGFVMASAVRPVFENNFLIFTRDKTLLDVHRKQIIDDSIEFCERKLPCFDDSEYVYNRYIFMLLSLLFSRKALLPNVRIASIEELANHMPRKAVEGYPSRFSTEDVTPYVVYSEFSRAFKLKELLAAAF